MPWQLVWRLAVAVGVGVAVSAWALRADDRSRREEALDVTLSILIGAALGGRTLVLAVDAILLGALPDPRALLTLGPGLSVPGALVGGALAGWRRRRSISRQGWADAGLVISAGLAAFAAAHLPDGLLANAVRVLFLGGAAVSFARQDPTGWHPGIRLLAVVATVHLAGVALSPSLATVDTDIDVALTAAVLGGGLLAHPRVGRATRRLAGLVTTVMVVAVAVASVTAVTDLSSIPRNGGEGVASVAGAIRADATPADVPRWGGTDLAAFIQRQDGPVVVNLWASWCPPCHAEAPAVARAATALEGRAAVIGVLVDDDAADGQAFADRYDLGFPTVIDAGVSDTLGMTGLPTTVVLSADGTVVQRVVGGLSQAALADAVTRAERGT